MLEDLEADSALSALDSLVAHLDSSYIFAGPRRGPFDVHNFRRREWSPAVEASGIAKPARLCDLRSTFASNALAAGITVYELARIMGTSVGMMGPTTAHCSTRPMSRSWNASTPFGHESGMSGKAELQNRATLGASRT